MNTPKILESLSSAPRTANNLPDKFTTSLKMVEQGIADQKMYNADYENAKYWVNEGCEKALDVAAEPWRELYRSGNRPHYIENDPRFNIGYFVSPLHATSAYNKLKKYQKEPVVAAYMEVLQEVGQVGELQKKLKPFLVKGRKPSDKPVDPATLHNTGICPVCMKRQKLTFDSKMVDHGYTIPHGWGGRNGHCLGFKHMPYELSNEGCIYFKGILVDQKKRNLVYIDRLEAGEVPEFVFNRKMYKGPGRYENEREVVKQGDPKYPQCVENAIAQTKQENSMIDGDVKNTDKLITDWTLQPLKYGGPETQERWKNRLQQK